MVKVAIKTKKQRHRSFLALKEKEARESTRKEQNRFMQSLKKQRGRMTPEQAARIYGAEKEVEAVSPYIKTSERGQEIPSERPSTRPIEQPQAKPTPIPEPTPRPQPRPSPQPQPQPQPKPQPQPRPTPQPIPKPKPKPKPRPEFPPPKIPVKPPMEPPIKMGGKLSDTEKRQLIKEAPGAIAWPQGKLADNVWHTVLEPYSQPRHYIVVGKAPEGAKLYPGPREAYKSITQLYGKGPRTPVKLEGGAIDPVLYSEGGRTKIGFVKDITNRRHHRMPKTRITQSSLAPDIVEVSVGGHRRRHLTK